MNRNFTSDRLEKTDDTELSMDKTSVKREGVDYTCSICEVEFVTEVLLFDHYSSVHSDEVVNFCKICHLMCPTESIFKIHNSILHSDRRIPYQERLSPQQSRERVHQSSPSDDRSNDRTPYACSVCEALFFHENLLTEHVKDHTEDEPYGHPKCGENIPKTSDVKIRLSKKLRDKMKLTCDTSESMLRSNASFKEQHSQSASEFRSPNSSNLPPGTNAVELSDICYDCNVCKAHFLCEELLVQHVNELPCAAQHSQNALELRCQSSPDPPIISNVDKGSDPRSRVCDICEDQFFSEDLLARHVSDEHVNDPQAETKSDSPHLRRRKLKARKRIKCLFCDKKFSSQYLVKEHMRVHTGEKPFECETCGKKFSHKNALREHTLRHHDDDSAADGAEEVNHARFKCPLCNEKFPAMTRLKTHLRAQHNVKSSFACSSCDSVFTAVSHLKIHYRECAPEDLFSCDTCETKFRDKKLLRLHLTKHRAERRFECGVCGKKFSYEYLLREHLPKHTGEKPFECDKCGRNFPYKGSLRAHRKQAHGDGGSAANTPVEEDLVEGHECDICGKKFKKKNLLRVHLWKHRAKEEKRFKCPFCPKRYSYNYLMVRHTARHAGEKPVVA